MGKLIIIAAVSLDGVIGIDDNMPWSIPEDFKHYRDTTMGHTLVCGSKTFKSLPDMAHEGRKFLILSSKGDDALDKDKYFHFDNINTLLDVVKGSNEDVYVIGGQSIYELLIKDCDELIITWVHKMFKDKGNKFFPISDIFLAFDDEEILVPCTKSVSGLDFDVIRYFKNNKKHGTDDNSLCCKK